MDYRKFGMPTLIELNSLEENAKLCRDLGLGFVEINMCIPEYLPMHLSEDLITELSSKYGVYFTFHLPDNYNPFDFNPYIVEASMKTISSAISISKKIGCKTLNLHLQKGDYFTLPDRKVCLYDKYRDVYLTSVKTFREQCEYMIGKDDIKICIENCSGFTDYHKAALDLLLESDVFALTLDTGHSFCSNFSDEQYIFTHTEKLRHMHLHDAIEKRNHLPLGEGNLDITRYYSICEKNNCTMVIETKTAEGLKKSVAWLKNQI